MSERNKALVRRTIEAVWNDADYSAIESQIAHDYLGHGSTETRGREGYRQFFADQRRAFPDIRYTIEDQIAEGDRVLTRWTARGTHEGPLGGLPPTGRRGTVTGMTIFRVAHDRVVECWTNLDELGMMRQLGVIPEPQPAG